MLIGPRLLSPFLVRPRQWCLDPSLHLETPEMVVEITYLTWTEGGLLRHTVYQGVRSKGAT
jgi:hypothetical protein